MKEWVLRQCSREWNQTGNPMFYLLYKYSQVNPYFLEDQCQRGGPNRRGYQDRKSLLQVLVNGLMTHGKQNAGKKGKILKLLVRSLSQARVQKTDKGYEKKRKDLPLSWYLALALARVGPLKTTRSIRYGSGTLTKMVWTTFSKRVNWFVRELVKVGRGDFCKEICKELQTILQRTTQSKLYQAQQASENSALRANIQ